MVLDMAGVIAARDTAMSTLNAQDWPSHSDGPIMVTAHDRDIPMQPDLLGRLFEQLRSARQR
jgi:hypothetical protein